MFAKQLTFRHLNVCHMNRPRCCLVQHFQAAGPGIEVSVGVEYIPLKPDAPQQMHMLPQPILR